MQARQISRGAAWRRDWLVVGLGGALITALLFATTRGGWGQAALLAGLAGGLAACATLYAVRGLIGGRLASQITLWLTVALVVMVLSPFAALQAYAGLAVVGIWALCIAFGEALA